MKSTSPGTLVFESTSALPCRLRRRAAGAALWLGVLLVHTILRLGNEQPETARRLRDPASSNGTAQKLK